MRVDLHSPIRRRRSRRAVRCVIMRRRRALRCDAMWCSDRSMGGWIGGWMEWCVDSARDGRRKGFGGVQTARSSSAPTRINALALASRAPSLQPLLHHMPARLPAHPPLRLSVRRASLQHCSWRGLFLWPRLHSLPPPLTSARLRRRWALHICWPRLFCGCFERLSHQPPATGPLLPCLSPEHYWSGRARRPLSTPQLCIAASAPRLLPCCLLPTRRTPSACVPASAANQSGSAVHCTVCRALAVC